MHTYTIENEGYDWFDEVKEFVEAHLNEDEFETTRFNSGNVFPKYSYYLQLEMEGPMLGVRIKLIQRNSEDVDFVTMSEFIENIRRMIQKLTSYLAEKSYVSKLGEVPSDYDFIGEPNEVGIFPVEWDTVYVRP